MALEVFRGKLALPAAVFEATRSRMEQPTPRVALGMALRGIATAAIDISDGLLGDLGHVLKRSGVGATVDADIAASRVAARTQCSDMAQGQWRDWALAGGDDYELLFCAPPSRRDAVAAAAQSSQTGVTRMGRIDAERGLRLVDAAGQSLPNTYVSFDHFA